ncbi:hypothetical protein E3N88_13365 [Mikania micrantha]|uniref:Uncharacterized protein n=1 Tax=Mikania micrantha TaxID=192012 RepID=A0A5N6PB18_9ASTR|nr:hypothetical protein E3N88_13365 [Mikania micrantha]
MRTDSRSRARSRAPELLSRLLDRARGCRLAAFLLVFGSSSLRQSDMRRAPKYPTSLQQIFRCQKLKLAALKNAECM